MFAHGVDIECQGEAPEPFVVSGGFAVRQNGETEMNYSEIKYFDIANGEGVRTSLFVSGCTHHCMNCFNEETWDFESGKPFDVATQQKIIDSLKPVYCDGLSVLGGEPMEPQNQIALVDFLERAKSEVPHKTIWVYTGDTYEDLLNSDSPRHTEVTERLLSYIDILIDGPFVQDLYDITLRFRGSSNQRIIDLPATRAAGKIIQWSDEEVYSTHSMA